MEFCGAPLSLAVAPPTDLSVSPSSSSFSLFRILSSSLRNFSVRSATGIGSAVLFLSVEAALKLLSPPSQLTVAITGATGFIGRRLVQKLLTDNHNVHVLTRSRRKAQSVFPVEKFPDIVISEEEDWKNCIEGSNAVVNLAGLPISTRWSSEVVDMVNNIDSDNHPSVLISATAIGYYGTSETQVFDETSPSGTDYLSEVCREWETKALEVHKDVRLTLIRIGVVLGKDGGALAKMIPLFSMFAGGPLGSGKQWFSWIHLDDLVNLIYEALRNPSYKGIINATAPNPVRLSEMCDQLGRVMGRPSWLPVPDFMLRAVLGDGAAIVEDEKIGFLVPLNRRCRQNNLELVLLQVLEGQKVLPVRAKELGFKFKYPFVKDALREIISSEAASPLR
ncbi:hypothetical protein AXF42_Ash007025 [Apostasia shenzhenica]|uniref:Uncharacterized protein n=1 Tax=Apostasia shenzhenica TaxID=1088818 RepID=A0A2I0BEW4_9ASPA|nr:hypothetical protein AXF42_Ash007025 [Apostasia shenzhenica]